MFAYLHVADGNTVIPAIPDDLVLDLLPALHTFLDENLWAGSKSFAAERLQLIFILCETGTETAESVCGTNNDGVSDRGSGEDGFLEVRGGLGLGTLLPDCSHRGCEKLSVLRCDDRLDRRSENADTKFGKFVLQFDTDVEGGLASKGDIDPVRTLVLDDLSHEFWGDWKEVDFIGEPLGSCDGSDVRVDHDGINSFLLQSLDRLRTGIVEFSGLADGKTSGSEDENLLNLRSRSPLLVFLLSPPWHGDRDRRAGGGAIEDVLNENVEKKLGIPRSWRRFGVELDGEMGFSLAIDAFVTSVVCIPEELFPPGFETGRVDLVTVVLTRDVTPAAEGVDARDVLATVPVFHLGRCRACGQSKQLVTEADAEDWGI